MNEITLKKDRVLEAASKCSTAKRTLEILCPEFFDEKKPKFELGTYWKVIQDHVENGKIGRLIKLSEPNSILMEFDMLNDRFSDRQVVAATKEEIENALVKEAEKRGFKEGAVFLTLERERGYTTHIFESKYDYCNEENNKVVLRCLSPKKEWGLNGGKGCSNPAIYKDGIWATIIKEGVIELTLEDIAKKFGKDVKQIKIID